MAEEGWSSTGWQDWSQTGSQQNWQQQGWQQGQWQEEDEDTPQQDPHSVRIWPGRRRLHEIQRELFEHGINCRLEFEVYGDLWVFQVIPLPGEEFLHLAENLPQFAEERHGKLYHISICYESEAAPYADRIQNIKDRWHGWEGNLECLGWTNVGQETSNGGNFLVGAPLILDPDVEFLHDNGYYWDRLLHISF
jgi:hypothetical protein